MNIVHKAWELYCDETAGGMHVADFWEELPESVQEYYVKRVEKGYFFPYFWMQKI